MHPRHPFNLRKRGLKGWQAIDRCFDTAFGSDQNPLRHLGAIGILALSLLIGSGLVLYIFFDTSVSGAWQSVNQLRYLPLGVGHLLRGVHHYAADLLIIAVMLHLLREWLQGHASGARYFHWLTGVPLLVFCLISSIGGFWLAWDQLGHYSALSTAEWLDALPGLASPLARNFLTPNAITDRMFSLFIFVHVGVPLLLLFGLWFHIQRLAHVSIWPPRQLTLGILGTLALLALARPVLSHEPAMLNLVPTELRLDWLLLWLHPLVDATSPRTVLFLVTATLLLLMAMPFLSRSPRAPAAVVDPEHCSGCTYCFDDCPYAAITMVPFPGGRPGQLLAQVDSDLCTSCGICTGSCPSSTPFRRGQTLKTGIDMPQLSVDQLRTQLNESLADAGSAGTTVVFSCAHGANDQSLRDKGVAIVQLLCIGQLPPSFVNYAFRRGATGVLVAGCCEAGCEYRLGERWTRQRLAGYRPPVLGAQSSISASRLQQVYAAPGQEHQLIAALSELLNTAGNPSAYHHIEAS